MERVTHLLDYPPRGTACGLYWPSELHEKDFGTYDTKEVTCKKCLNYLKRQGKTNETLSTNR